MPQDDRRHEPRRGRPRLAARGVRARDAEQPGARLGLPRVGAARDRDLVPRWAGVRDRRRAQRRELDRRQRDYTDENAETNWASDISWGIWAVDESELNVLGDVHGLDVVELGCGTAYFSAWLARAGARPVGVDITPAQLETARRMMAKTGIEFPLVEADAGATGLPAASFDLVLSEYGASIWVDPYRWIPEAARLLRPGGRLVFLCNSPLVVLCSEDEGAATTTLQRPLFGMHRFEWTGEVGVEFHLPHGRWIDLLRENGLRRRAARRGAGPARRGDARVLRIRHGGVGATVACRGHLGRAQALVDVAAPCATADARIHVTAAARDPGAAGRAVRGVRAGLRRGARNEPTRPRSRQGPVAADRRAASARCRHGGAARRRAARQAGRRDRGGGDARVALGAYA